MHTTTQTKIAAPEMGTATVDDLWGESDALGIPACALFAATQKLGRLDPQDLSD